MQNTNFFKDIGDVFFKIKIRTDMKDLQVTFKRKQDDLIKIVKES